jgi:hypothetical protein
MLPVLALWCSCGVALLALLFDTHPGLHAFFRPPCAVYIRPNTVSHFHTVCGMLQRHREGGDDL